MSINKRLIGTGGAGINPTDYFDIITYIGNGSTRSFSSLNFQPDLVWFKERYPEGFAHNLYDSNRGIYQALNTASTAAEGTSTQGLQSFDTNGFTVGNVNQVNSSGRYYVAWSWKEAPEYGFSIVSYTGNGVNRNIAHGLNQAAELVIIKSTSATYQWMVGHKDFQNYYNELPNDEPWTSNSTRSITLNTTTNGVTSYFKLNASGQDYIMYSFHSVDGLQKIGTYTGTGSSGNTVTGLGFAPRFVFIKGNNASDWLLKDKDRDALSTNETLFANLNSRESSSTTLAMSYDSNGFTLNGTSTQINQSGVTYIYLAIA